MTPGVPVVERTGYRNGCRVRSPDGETNSGDAFELRKVRAEGVPSLLQGAFAVEVQIEFRDDRGKR